ncbi:MAG: hypothetical protein KAT30_16615, partial [Candidatus Krumholzibacteria bacterium]|nr:hypothetical protein [Candidatus Krumholzibacteria bacterium]
LGTAIDTVDVVAVKAWTDDGDGIFTPSQDPPLGELSWTGARWERTGMAHPIPAGGTRVFVAVDIADNPHEGRSVRLALPSLPDVAVGMASENDGPIDDAVENPVVQTISTDDRVVLSAAPVSSGSVSPGQRDVVLLQLTATNNYKVTKQMTRLTVANTSIPQGAATQDDLDREFDNLQLREDANDNGALDDTATDPVVGTAVFVSGTASFTGLAWNLPALTSRNLFVTTGVSLQDAHDGDVLDAAVYGAYDVDFSDVTSVIADWPVKAVGQHTVDGMIAAQITLQNIAGVTLAPGDGPSLALDVVLPGNGYADDILNALTVENAGTAAGSDISEVRAWRDGGDNAFDAGAGDDVEIGQLFPSGNIWISSLLNEPLPAAGTQVFVGITVGGTPTDSATV